MLKLSDRQNKIYLCHLSTKNKEHLKCSLFSSLNISLPDSVTLQDDWHMKNCKYASGDALWDLQLIFFGLNYNELLSVFKVKTVFVQDKEKKSVITKKIWHRKSSAARKMLTKTHYQVWFNVWLKQKAVYEFFIQTYKTYKNKIFGSPCEIWINRKCNYLQIL